MMRLNEGCDASNLICVSEHIRSNEDLITCPLTPCLLATEEERLAGLVINTVCDCMEPHQSKRTSSSPVAGGW